MAVIAVGYGSTFFSGKALALAIKSFAIKQTVEKIVGITSSEKRPIILNVCMKLLVPATKAILNPMDMRTFSSLCDFGKKTATNAYPGTKTKKGIITTEEVGVPRTRKMNTTTE